MPPSWHANWTHAGMPLGSPQRRTRRFALTARLLASIATALTGAPITDDTPPLRGCTPTPPPVGRHVVWIAFGRTTDAAGSSNPPFLAVVEDQCRAVPPPCPAIDADHGGTLDVAALEQDRAADTLPRFTALAPHPCHGPGVSDLTAVRLPRGHAGG